MDSLHHIIYYHLIAAHIGSDLGHPAHSGEARREAQGAIYRNILLTPVY